MFAFEKLGSGPAILFLHGFCQSSAYWTPAIEEIDGRGLRCIAPDLPGFGASASQSGPYTMEGLADSVAQFLDERDLSGVTVVGGSMGGVVAQHLTLRHPNKVNRLMLVATGAVTADPAGALVRADAIEASPWTEEAVNPIVNAFFYRPPASDKLRQFKAIALQASKQAAIDATRSNALSRTLDQLSEIKIPTMVIQGRHDRVRTPQHGEEMCRRLSNGRLIVIEEAAHTPQVEQTATFVEAALPFLLAPSQ